MLEVIRTSNLIGIIILYILQLKIFVDFPDPYENMQIHNRNELIQTINFQSETSASSCSYKKHN